MLDKRTAYRECYWVSLALRSGNGDPRGGIEMEKVGRGGYLIKAALSLSLFHSFSLSLL